MKLMNFQRVSRKFVSRIQSFFYRDVVNILHFLKRRSSEIEKL